MSSVGSKRRILAIRSEGNISFELRSTLTNRRSYFPMSFAILLDVRPVFVIASITFHLSGECIGFPLLLTGLLKIEPKRRLDSC